MPFPWDLEGRICVTLLASRRCALVNVYAVNGTSRAHWNNERNAFEGDRHAFKQMFIERLGRELVQKPFEGLRLILVGDWNVSRARIDVTPRLRIEEPHATARRRFNDEFMTTLDLADVFRERNPEARAFTWFNRRARHPDAARVDYALVASELVPRVTDAEILSAPNLRVGSDHAPISIAIR